MSKFTHTLIVFLSAATTVLAVNSTEPPPFQAGIEAYENGHHATAKAHFLTALETNETAAARHNLGLTEFQLGHPAEAIRQIAGMHIV